MDAKIPAKDDPVEDKSTAIKSNFDYDNITTENHIEIVRMWNKSRPYCVFVARAYRNIFLTNPNSIRDTETTDKDILEFVKKNNVLIQQLIKMKTKYNNGNMMDTYCTALSSVTDFKVKENDTKYSGSWIYAQMLEDFVFAHNIERANKLSGNKHFICCYCRGLDLQNPQYNTQTFGLEGKSPEEQKHLVNKVLSSRVELFDMFLCLKKQVRYVDVILFC